MNANEIRTAASNLPKLPILFATSMIYAQAWKPSKEETAAIQARKAFFRSLEVPDGLNITVKHPQTGETIGYMQF
jgi:hypothetical protein